MEHNKFYTFLLVLLSSFFCASTVGVNKKAKNPNTTTIVVLADILSHGVSGGIIGLLATRYISDVFTLSAIAGIGGLMGSQVLQTIVKVLVISFANAKGVSVEDINKMRDEEE